MNNKSIRKLCFAGLLVAVAVIGSLLVIPVFGAKCSPVQHMVNVTAAMIGALLSGLAYRIFPKLSAAYAGEVFGTGVLGAIASYPVAALLMGNSTAALFTFVPSFLASTVVGAAVSVLVLSALKRTHVFSQLEGTLR